MLETLCVYLYNRADCFEKGLMIKPAPLQRRGAVRAYGRMHEHVRTSSVNKCNCSAFSLVTAFCHRSLFIV